MRHASYLQTEEKLTLLVVTVSNTKTKTTLALIWNLKKKPNTGLSKEHRVWSEWKQVYCATTRLTVSFNCAHFKRVLYILLYILAIFH